jgi:sugar/nucleoside kinase (ribokinase family)
LSIVHSKIDYLAIGHVARDVVPGGYRLGGTVAFAALTARALGLGVGVVTSLAAEVPLPELESVVVERIHSPQSTIYDNRYTPEGRTQYLHGTAAPLTPASIPPDWQQARIVHLAPIAREVSPELTDFFSHTFIGITPQGWMRQWDETGRVSPRDWEEAAYILPRASATVISIEDVHGDWALAGTWAAQSKVFVVTEGEQGATVFAGGLRQRVEAPQVQAVDPTGAGDIFAASFFVRLEQTGDPLVAARFAVSVASESVARVGLEGVPGQSSGVRSQKSE